MSESKLCPMRKETISDAYRQIRDSNELEQPKTEVFLVCIQEKCAWWIPEQNIVEELARESIAVSGHCVIADMGKI